MWFVRHRLAAIPQATLTEAAQTVVEVEAEADLDAEISSIVDVAVRVIGLSNCLTKIVPGARRLLPYVALANLILSGSRGSVRKDARNKAAHRRMHLVSCFPWPCSSAKMPYHDPYPLH